MDEWKDKKGLRGIKSYELTNESRELDRAPTNERDDKIG